jgi:cobalamin biosynthesis Mg chelatase CobN
LTHYEPLLTIPDIFILTTEFSPQDLLPDRVDRLAQRLKRWVQLRRTAPQQRKAKKWGGNSYH